MRPQSLPAAIGRGGQAVHAGHRNRHRAELHDSLRDVHVGDCRAHAAEQEAVAWGIERIIERGMEFRRATAAEYLHEEISHGRVIAARAGNDGRANSATAGNVRKERFAAWHVGDDRRLHPCAHVRESLYPRNLTLTSSFHYQNIFSHSWEEAH